VVCGTCDIKRGGTTAACHGCGTVAPLVAGLCDRCRLGERVAELAAGAEETTADLLAPFFAQLAASPNAASTLRWFYTPGFEVTRRLLAGEIALSHQGLDQAAIAAPQAVAFLRAKLVHCGVLEPRDETSASFARWHAEAVLQVGPGTDRAHVRAYAAWHVASQVARAGHRRGEASYASLKYARSLVTEAIKLTVWLHAQRLELVDLRQDLVDEWIAAGRLTRRRVRLFLVWLERAGVIGALEVAWHDGDCARVALGEAERFAILRRLLHDREVDLRDRFAGSVLLLYGKPLTRICALTTAAVLVGGEGERRLRLGRGEVPLPEPLGEITLALLERAGADGWLLPGRHAGTHIGADSLSRRLKPYGLDRAREGRHAALLALAARLPAPILAERVGIHQARAAQWVRLAGANYGEYVALRAGS
jgi:hypothetical protein